jgi:hypothetical protein
MPNDPQTTNYSERNRSPLWGFLATTDRFSKAWFAMMGGFYLLGVPTSIRGICIAGAVGVLWGGIGLLVGDAFWGWPGLFTRKVKT